MQIRDRFDFEFETATVPRVSYMICSLPRSGSSLLCEMLANTLHAGMPAEYLRPDRVALLERRWGIESFDEYLRTLLERKTSPNGVFGLKVHWGQYGALEGRDPRDLFPGLRFVQVHRADRLRQAVSWVRAFQTGSWSTVTGPGSGTAVFDRDEIARKLRRLEHEQAEWDRLFERLGVTPHAVSYEELASAPERVTREVLERIGVQLPEGFELDPPLMERQSDEVSDQWVTRYLAETTA